MTHKELDELFRSNSERGDFSPEPGEWEEMTALLDEDERREKIAAWVSTAWISLFILLIAFGIFSLSQTTSPFSDATVNLNSNQVELPKRTTDTQENNSKQAKVDQKIAAPSDQIKSTNTNLASSIPTSANLNSQQTSSQNQPPKSSAGSQAKTINLNSSLKQKTLPSSNVNILEPSPLLTAKVPGAVLNTVNTSEIPLAVLPNKGQPSQPVIKQLGDITSQNQELKILDQAPEQAKPLDLIPNLELTQLLITPEGLTNNVLQLSKSNLGRIGLSVFVAEELTSVGMHNKTSYGTKIGLLGRYYWGQKWSIDFGATYSRKQYRAPGSEMTELADLFVDDIMPIQTDGTVDILEFPLVLTYLPKGRDVNGFFFSGGVLNQIVFKEHMHFHYNQHAPNQVHEMLATDALFVPFNSAQFSAGYRFAFAKGPYFRIGPYVNLPMRNMGNGKLPIYCTGLNLEIELF